MFRRPPDSEEATFVLFEMKVFLLAPMVPYCVCWASEGMGSNKNLPQNSYHTGAGYMYPLLCWSRKMTYILMTMRVVAHTRVQSS